MSTMDICHEKTDMHLPHNVEAQFVCNVTLINEILQRY